MNSAWYEDPWIVRVGGGLLVLLIGWLAKMCWSTCIKAIKRIFRKKDKTEFYIDLGDGKPQHFIVENTMTNNPPEGEPR